MQNSQYKHVINKGPPRIGRASSSVFELRVLAGAPTLKTVNRPAFVHECKRAEMETATPPA